MHSNFNNDITLYNGYCYSFKDVSNIKTLQDDDRRAADYIKQNEENIATLKEYRRQLFDHVQKIVSSPEKLTLEIWRHANYKDNIFYDVTLKNTIAGIKNPQTIISESYKGKQRFEAMARFKELQKQYPQAEAIDLSKKR